MGVIEDELSTRTLMGRFTPDMARELAISQKVCVRPLIRRLIDRDTNTEQLIALPCGSTRAAICPPCAQKAKVLRMQQCAAGWHRTDEPEHQPSPDCAQEADDQDDGEGSNEGNDMAGDDDERRVRSTRRRDDAADLPRVPVEDRTVGRVFIAPDGQTYRPSMFLTLTLPSYGPIRPGSHGIPVSPRNYDYRRAALDALHFAKLLDRFWQNLRRCAGYNVQYFAAVEPQARLAPHLHAAVRGAIARDILRQVIKATYVQVWWPPHDDNHIVYPDAERLPRWTGAGYADPDTGVMLPTWKQALDRLAADPDGRPVHVMRFGAQTDMRGIIAPSQEADRAVRYLTKYLTKAITDPLTGAQTDGTDQAEVIVDKGREAHIERLYAELKFLPCSPGCANWLRYGVQPKKPSPGLRPGWCASKAHDREHLGLGGRRVMVSRQWSGKTLSEHRADRATVVREALLTAGIVAPEVERMAADVVSADGEPRFVWTDTRPDTHTYTRLILESIAERHRWRQQYERAKTAQAAATRSTTSRGAVDGLSATDQPP